MQKVKKILTALQGHLNKKNYQQLAEYLDIKTTTIYSWVKNDNIANTGKILAKCPYLSLNWLETGEGPMAIIDKSNIDQLPSSWPDGLPPELQGYVKAKISARIEPGNERQRQRIEGRKALSGKQEIQKETEKEGEQGLWSMSEMLVMTTAVLESNTVYRSALAANVRAFYQAVKREDEMRSISEKLEVMEKNETEMAERMARMEAMLLSLGAAPQKREQNAG